MLRLVIRGQRQRSLLAKGTLEMNKIEILVDDFNVILQAAGKLKITDKGVLSSLLRLASDDNSWKVKAHTIKG